MTTVESGSPQRVTASCARPIRRAFTHCTKRGLPKSWTSHSQGKPWSVEFAQDLTSAAYASHLDELASKAHLWVHGHVHDSFNYLVGNCRVVANPCGYIQRDGTQENERFDPNLIIELAN